MPFTVSCPHCSAKLRVRDEYIGRAMKCPTCQGVIPAEVTRAGADSPLKSATRPNPPSEDDAPRTPAKQRPRDDEDDRPRSKRRSREDEEDEDDEGDRPRSRRRARDEDDDDEDRPRSRRRRDDDEDADDRPRSRRRSGDKPKKKGGLGLILGILGGVFLLCGGGCAGVWFGFVKPAQDKLRAQNDLKEQEFNEAMAKGGQPSKPGATVSAVEVLAVDLTAEYTRDAKAATARYQGKKLRVTGKVKELTDGAVLLVGKPSGRDNPAVVAFVPNAKKTLPYKPGEWVSAEGVCGGWYPGGGASVLQISECQVKPAPVPPNLPPDDAPNPPPTTPNGPVMTTDAEMIAHFIRDITSPDRLYAGKQIKLTGKVIDVAGSDVYFGGKEANNYTYQVLVKMTGPPTFKKGDTVTVAGKYKGYATSLSNGTRTITVADGATADAPKPDPSKPDPPKPDPGKPADDKPIEVTAEDLLAEYAADAKAAAEKYKGKVLKVTGEVKQTTAASVILAGKAEGGFAYQVSAMLPFDQRTDLTALKPGVKVTVTGKAGPLGTRNTTKTKTLLLTESRLVK